MSTIVNFFGKKCIEPGSYSAMRYTPHSAVNVAEFGNVLVIDTGLSMEDHNPENKTVEFAGGSGISGNGIKSTYVFNNITDFKNFMGGGLMVDIAEKIFSPVEGVPGAPKLYYTRAAETTPATLVIDDNGNTLITLTCLNEGIVGNGQIDTNGVLQVGYSAEIVPGTVDPNKFKLIIRKGTYGGTDKDGEAFGNVWGAPETSPMIIYESSEFSTSGELYNEMKYNEAVTSQFNVELNSDDSLFIMASILSTGGNTVFNADYFREALDAVAELDVTFILCTNLTVADSVSGYNTSLFSYIKTAAKYTEFMFVPGGGSKSELFGNSGTTQAAAQLFNSNQVVVVHGAPIVPRKDGNGTKTLYPIYLTASIMGMNAGAQPQTPMTFKKVGYKSFEYDLTQNEREDALKYGIMHVRNVNGYWVVNQGINSIQWPNNLQTINQNGESFELSIELIKAQMNKEITIDAQNRFTGLTAAQTSPASVKSFTEAKLSSFVAEPGADNLIIRWKNVNVTVNNSDYTIYYDFVPNVPVNKTFFVGNILDFTL